MIGATKQDAGLRPITAGYLRCLAFALLGLVFAAIGVGAVLEAKSGHDQDLTYNAYGIPAFIFVGFLGFFFRLIFWRRVPEAWQARVRLFMTAVIGLEVIGVIGAVIWFWNNAPAEVASLGATGGSTIVIAALCQIATVTWLLRYRRE